MRKLYVRASCEKLLKYAREVYLWNMKCILLINDAFGGCENGAGNFQNGKKDGVE